MLGRCSGAEPRAHVAHQQYAEQPLRADGWRCAQALHDDAIWRGRRGITMASSFAAFINARVRGMKSALLSRNDLETMLNSGRLDQIGDMLMKSPYETELAEALARYQGADAIEDAVTRNLVNTFTQLKA